VVATALPVLALREVAPRTSTFMLLARLGATSGPRCRRVDYVWVDWERIAPAMRLAAVAAEDQRFPAHPGFDLASIHDALRERRAGGRARGASTISQQVAKNLFLWPERSVVRKGFEAWITLWLELLWPKRRILEVYLNVAQLGPCTFGVEAASRRFFDKPASRLDASEAALLAAALPRPTDARVDAPSPWLRARAAHVRREMRRLGPDWLDGLEG
jgi:monofunctional biosynthetic peptidoglycan transglycosylase